MCMYEYIDLTYIQNVQILVATSSPVYSYCVSIPSLKVSYFTLDKGC